MTTIGFKITSSSNSTTGPRLAPPPVECSRTSPALPSQKLSFSAVQTQMPQNWDSIRTGAGVSEKVAFRSVATHLTARRRRQDIVGIHGAQLVPAPVPPGLALDAHDLMDPLQTIHADGIQMHQSPCSPHTHAHAHTHQTQLKGSTHTLQRN